ncbi:uncharacterized protein UV8b_00010 [Ustilaginoidea virens]|uniref:C2 domain protein n=1 Tax=Ustilaginoidea virens TaxID=1159556 RepID=A0A8E5HHZ0_USTVR|nr:uncharacterized protein UV8b_00010 [Ustilaginoidea virens]QUC15769.1 hypothetical protein UV8b_00010 [Ustilaginoidea virens]
MNKEGLADRQPSASQTIPSPDPATHPPTQNSPLKADPTPYGQAYSERNPPTNIQAFHNERQKVLEASKRYLESDQTWIRKPRQDKHEYKQEENALAMDDTPKAGQTNDVPIGGEKSNVLFHPTPEPNFERVFDSNENPLMMVSYTVFGVIVFLDWLFIGGGLKGFVKSLFPAGGVAAAVYFILQTVGENVASHKIDEAEQKTEKLRYVPESVEWMNSLVETLWGTLQQEFFDSIAAQVNEAIKPYIPKSAPVSVRITSLGHGNQPARVLSMRSLPDSEFGELVPSHGTRTSLSAGEAKEREKAIEREEGGVFYNLEIAMAYHQSPLRSRKDHMHADILVRLGPVPLPVFVQVKEFFAVIRVRLQMHPDLPFLKMATFALTEHPKINACVSIGAPWAFDLLNLPIIDSVLNSQINAAMTDFVQPKSTSLDMTAYIGGSDEKEETEAIGVLVVKIHRARNLARQDTRGPGADPYLTIAFSQYEKPMYASRIIKGDRNPVWEESANIMIRTEHVKRQENVLLRLWDSDTTGSDDVSGICEFPLQELILHSSEMHKREDRLQGDTAGTDAEGVLEWEIGYFPREEFEKKPRPDGPGRRDHDGEQQKASEEMAVQNAQNTVPNPGFPTGILGLTIHQCLNVEVENPHKQSLGYVKVLGQDWDGDDDAEAETVSIDYIPSLYVAADVNDKLAYRTRVKSISNSPVFNSSTETCIRDWRAARVTLSVWDTRKRSDDCLVGVVALKLPEVFHESSSVVKYYDLNGGAGKGRIRVGMIFRSVGVQLEKPLLGYDVGTFAITSPIFCIGHGINTRKLTLRTGGSRRVVKGGERSEGGYSWTLDKKQSLLPVHYRYMSPLVLEFAGITEVAPGPLSKMANKNKHYAIIWLSSVIDDQTQQFTLPVFKTNNPTRLLQNAVSESDDAMKLEKVGEARFTGCFKPGLDESHEEFVGKGNGNASYDQWSSYRSWEAARKSGS